MSDYRVFQIAVTGRGIPPLVWGKQNFAEEIFYSVVGTWELILTIWTFFKAKNNIL